MIKVILAVIIAVSVLCMELAAAATHPTVKMILAGEGILFIVLFIHICMTTGTKHKKKAGFTKRQKFKEELWVLYMEQKDEPKALPIYSHDDWMTKLHFQKNLNRSNLN